MITGVGLFEAPGQLLHARGPVRPQLRRAAALAATFFESLEETVHEAQPSHRYLARDEEELMARYCIVLAYFERLYRAGLEWETPLERLPPKPRLSDLLRLPQPEVVQDVVDLSMGACEDGEPYWDQAAILNPVFAGSQEIGGADADLILGGCLCEIKTVTTWSPKDVRAWMKQTLGYVLLDWDDAHAIRSVALWLPRQRWLKGWPLFVWLFPAEEVLHRLRHGVGFTKVEVMDRLGALRSEMREVCGALDASNLSRGIGAQPH